MISIKHIKEKFNIKTNKYSAYQVKPINYNTVIINKVGDINKLASANNIIHKFQISDNIEAKVISVLILEKDFLFINQKDFYPLIKLNVNDITIYYVFLPNKKGSFLLDKPIIGTFGIFMEKDRKMTFIKTTKYESHDKILLDLVEVYYS